MQNRTPAITMLLVTAGLLVIGAFLPWATVSAGGFKVSVSGTQGSDGYITLLCGAYIGFIAWTKMQGKPVAKGMMIGLYVAIGLALAIGVMNFSSIDDAAGAAALGVSASVGIGLWLTIAAAIVGIVGAVTIRKEDAAGGSTSTTATPPSSPF
jgi:predicted small integral membrane protein